MDRIGRYRLSQRIGAGAFATVWLGHHDALGAEVAVKVLAENWALDANVAGRFLNEARLLGQINDDHVVAVHEVGTLPDGRPYFVMDHCNAGSLADLTRLRFGLRQALQLCAEAARGLDVVHRHGVLHRDVTPANLLLDRDPTGTLRVQVVDLGVARLLGGRVTTMTAGTPAYMAIEQARGQQMDQRADVYSLACVTHTVLTGRPPFEVRSLDALLQRPPDPARDLAPVAASVGAPTPLDSLLAAALSPDPGHRPGTAAALALALDQLADAVPPTTMLPPRAAQQN